jgi:hypothetical protein
MQGAVGPALFGLPVTLAATDLAQAAKKWFRRLRRSDGLSRIVRAVAGDLDLSDEEFAAIRRLLEKQVTWVEIGHGTVEDLAALIASCLPGRTDEGSLTAGRAIAGGLLEFAVRDLEPEWFRQVLFARLERIQADQASALDQAMLSVHAGLAALVALQETTGTDRFAFVMNQLERMLDRLPPGPADRGELEVYLATLVSWLNTDPWPQDTRFAGPALTPAAIERKLRIADTRGRGGADLDADDLARQSTRLVVLGGPGSGKTWLARRTARLCAEAALGALAEGALPDEVEVPLYTTCARLAAAPPGDSIRRAVVASALGQLPDLGGARVYDALRMLFEERNAPTLLVADSLDEARGADDRIRQADTLPNAWRVVLTTRPASWNRQLVISGDDPSRRVGTLQPLRYPRDVEPFIATWFSHRPAWAAGVVAQLRDRPALQQAATVPLILAFYCIVGSDQLLPGRRADLYAKVIRRMLTGRWRGSGDRDPDPDACMDILRGWAWSAAASNPVSGIGEWTDEFATPRLMQSQDDRDALGHVAVPLSPPDVDTGTTQRRFVHRSLREHLVAEYIAVRMPAEQAAAELVTHLWCDPDWEYAAPAALAMHPERDQVLTELICRLTPDGQQLAVIDSGWEIRRFLARVALESAEGDWTPEAAGIIGQARLDLATSGQDDRRLIVGSEWPTSNFQAIQSLPGLLCAATDFLTANALMETLARLAVTAEDRARARETLLTRLGSQDDPTMIRMLVEAVTRLAVTAEERVQARDALVSRLASTPDPWNNPEKAEAFARLDGVARDRAWKREAELADLSAWRRIVALAHAVARLAVTAREQAQAREVLLTLLASMLGPSCAMELAKTVAGLDPAPQDKVRARETLLTLQARSSAYWPAWKLAEAAAWFAATAGDRAQARKALLTQLARQLNPVDTRKLAETFARLAVTAEEQAQAREALLKLLISTPYPELAEALVEPVARLAESTEDPSPVRKALLTLLARTDHPPLARAVGEALARLAVTPEDRARAREVLLTRLGSELHPIFTWVLAEAVAPLAVTAEDRARAREALLTLVAGTPDPWSAAELAEGVARLDPPPRDQARAREALLTMLAETPDPWHASELAEAVAALDPPPRDQARALDTLLTLLAGTLDPATDRSETLLAQTLAEAVAGLDPTPGDRARAREVLLTLLADRPDSHYASGLVKEVVRLAVTAEDRVHARGALLTLLASAPDPELAKALMDAVAELGPTVDDLDGSDAWPHPLTPALLAAARPNSGLSAWLAALPLLSVRVQRD